MVKIYALLDPTTDEIRYIGKTCRSLEYRLREHIYDCIRRPRSSHKVNWISNLISNNKIPKIKLLETIEFEYADTLERHWIEKLTNENVNLTNCTQGGEFCTFGSKLSEDIREDMSIKAKIRSIGEKNNMFGRKHRQDSKKKMSDKKIGIYDGVNNPRAKKIFQYDDDDKLIKVWEYAKECADFFNISRGNISTFAKYNTNIDNLDVPIKNYKKLRGMVFKFK